MVQEWDKRDDFNILLKLKEELFKGGIQVLGEKVTGHEDGVMDMFLEIKEREKKEKERLRKLDIERREEEEREREEERMVQEAIMRSMMETGTLYGILERDLKGDNNFRGFRSLFGSEG